MRVQEEMLAADSDDELDDQSDESSDNQAEENLLAGTDDKEKETAPKTEETTQQEDDDETKGMDAFQRARFLRKKEEEVKKMKEFCDANGFQIDNLHQQNVMDRLEALDKFEPTKEWFEEKRKKCIMENLVPPPLEIMTRKYVNKEPVRTGFNQGLLNVDIRNNFETARCAQGPQVIISSSAMKRREPSKEQTKPANQRSLSRENSLSRADKDAPLRNSMTSARKGENDENMVDEG